jgi:hypothetical protein
MSASLQADRGAFTGLIGSRLNGLSGQDFDCLRRASWLRRPRAVDSGEGQQQQS